MRSAPTPHFSPAGTRQHSRAAFFSRPRHSNRGSSPAPTRMRMLRRLAANTTKLSRTRGLASLLSIATACAHPSPSAAPSAPGTEPELRIGLSEQSSISLGGDGELIVTDDGNGQLLGSIAVGTRWSVIPDSGGTGVRVVQPDGTVSDP